jgi:hypothetical protein
VDALPSAVAEPRRESSEDLASSLGRKRRRAPPDHDRCTRGGLGTSHRMTVVAIHQPQYLPWQPYFAKALASDLFVYLDTVQFQKNGVQNRNQVKTAHGARWLTVPVHASLERSIAETGIAREPWARKHIVTIEQSYRGAPGMAWFLSKLAPLMMAEHPSLADLSIALCEAMFDRLGARCRRVRASSLGAEGTKESLVIDIARKVGATRYLSGVGAASYQRAENFEREGITLSYVHHRPSPYTQRHPALGFIEDLSSLDLLLNVDEGAHEHVMRGILINGTALREGPT